jgi:hypothetical protein
MFYLSKYNVKAYFKFNGGYRRRRKNATAGIQNRKKYSDLPEIDLHGLKSEHVAEEIKNFLTAKRNHLPAKVVTGNSNDMRAKLFAECREQGLFPHYFVAYQKGAFLIYEAPVTVGLRYCEPAQQEMLSRVA